MADPKSCPCEFEEVEPCGKFCSCRYPHLSGGCDRCCKYGSHEQQVQAAKYLQRRLSTMKISPSPGGSPWKDRGLLP